MNELVTQLGYSYYLHYDCFITIHSLGKPMWMFRNLDHIKSKYGPNLGYRLNIPVLRPLTATSRLFSSETMFSDANQVNYYILEVDLY